MRRALFLLAPLLPALLLLLLPSGASSQERPFLPAPTEDRVGFPDSYQTDYQLFYTFDRPDNRSARFVYANEAAASAQPGEPYPYGSILVMEVYRALLTEAGQPALDEDGRYTPGDLSGIFVMRKEAGFGADYQHLRNGEWEYVFFRPDGSYGSPPSASGACAACHLDAGGTRDWVWRGNLFFYGQSGALPTAPSGLAEVGRIPMQSYLFLPDAITVRPGTTVTWSNEDSAVHTVTAREGLFSSGRLPPGAAFRYTFDEPGVYDYVCTLHPTSMSARVVVEP